MLPRLPLDGGSHKRETATGTEGGPRQFAPGFAPNSGTDRQSGANADNQGRGENESGRECFSPVSPDDVKRKEPLSSADNGSSKSGRLDLNQRPLRPERGDKSHEQPVFLSIFTIYPLLSRVASCRSFIRSIAVFIGIGSAQNGTRKRAKNMIDHRSLDPISNLPPAISRRLRLRHPSRGSTLCQ